MNKKDILNLFDKYEKAECLPSETRMVDNFFDSYKKDMEWDESEHGNSGEVENRILQGIGKNIQPKIYKSKKRRLVTASALLVAASVSIVFFVSVMTFSTNLPEAKTAQVVNKVVRSTAKGQKYSIVLSDGTKVRLNAESQLVFPQKFSGNKREVELVGEAFFDVARNEKIPFIVKTQRLNTEVLGTSFNIKSYKDQKTTVSVATGKVKVKAIDNGHFSNGPKENVYLSPNQQVVYDPSSSYLKKTNIDLEKFIVWKDDVILFDEISFGEAAKVLEKWYDVKISFDQPSLINCSLLRSSYKNESLENVLKSLKFIQGIDFQFTNDHEVVIFGDICKT
ncbi:MAG: transmembrane sensor [Cyclobacteriaceae bacterium]|jgi:ferric-dicitrate binding protein FerR (iron transport regulator)